MARYDFWTHGVATQIEYPDRVLDGGKNTVSKQPRRWGGGIAVRQSPGTDNWFHIPLTTPTVLDGDGTVQIEYIRLRANIGVAATLHDVRISAADEIIAAMEVNGGSGRTYDEPFFDDMNVAVRSGLTVSLRISFHSSSLEGFRGAIGEVKIFGVGARFTA